MLFNYQCAPTDTSPYFTISYRVYRFSFPYFLQAIQIQYKPFIDHVPPSDSKHYNKDVLHFFKIRWALSGLSTLISDPKPGS
jgi:hypothetical protein